jgi:quercetin dioxygenase-like cupin family protein
MVMDACAGSIIPAMMNRRHALAAFALLTEWLATGRSAAAQTQTAPSSPGSGPRQPVFRQDLPNVTLDGWEVTASFVDYPPAHIGVPHRHAGFVLVYVLEGTVVAKISGGEERTYRAGEMFYEHPGATHEVSKNASRTEPARLLAMIFAKKGSTLTVPV